MDRSLNRRTASVILTGIAVALLAGCGGGQSLRPARISHIVLMKLEDPSMRDDLLADCDRLLSAIPGVVSYAAGRHLDVGRDSVDGNYDVGMYIGFETEAAYAGYVEHSKHKDFVETWRPELEWLRVHDILDETE